MVSPHCHRSPDDLGRRGLARLERYNTDGDAEALADGLALLTEAVAAAPVHPQRMRWWYGLGSAYESRADELGSIDDYDRAIGWYARIHAQLAPTDPDRTFIALALTGAHWSRFWLLRYGGAGEPEDCAALVEELLAAIARYPVGDWDVEAAAFVRMIQGLAWEERYQAGSDPADLDRGIVLLAGAVPVLPDDTPWLAVAAFTLATAYWDSYGRTGVPRELNLAIAMDARAMELSAEEDPTWLSAHEHEALCLATRWRRDGVRGDLDRAIASWRVALSRAEDAWSAGLGGELIRRCAFSNTRCAPRGRAPPVPGTGWNSAGRTVHSGRSAVRAAAWRRPSGASPRCWRRGCPITSRSSTPRYGSWRSWPSGTTTVACWPSPRRRPTAMPRVCRTWPRRPGSAPRSSRAPVPTIRGGYRCCCCRSSRAGPASRTPAMRAGCPCSTG